MKQKQIFISYEDTAPQIVQFHLAYEELPTAATSSINQITKHK
jgi:hypothetical protein